MAEPKKPVKYHHTDVKVRPHALYAAVVVECADGKLWEFPAASFYFDLKPYEPQRDAAQDGGKDG